MSWSDKLRQLETLSGELSVLTDPADFARYLDDLLGFDAAQPIAVVRPATTADVSKTVLWCQQHRISIVPQGGLTGLSSGAVGDGTYIILSLERMNRVVSFDQEDQSLLVQSGATLAAVRDYAHAHDLYFPLNHGASGSSQIGGNLSTNAGGNNALRYGVARDQVLGLEIVLVDGTIWNGLRNLRKNSAGYDLKHLFIGAEGSLGIVTAARLKLRPYPHNRVTGFVALENPGKALKLLRHLELYLGEMVSAFELCSSSSLEFALEMEQTRYPFDQMHLWNVLIEAETSARKLDLVDLFQHGLADAFEQELIDDAIIAQSSTQADELWHLRESIAAYFIEDKSSLKSDTAVPVSQVPQYLENCQQELEQFMPGIRPAPFGHLGDGNIHYNVKRPYDMSAEDFVARRKAVSEIIEVEALKLGGTISAEHGIGRFKREAFLRQADAVELSLMQTIKNALDKENRLNPGISYKTGQDSGD